MEHPARAESHRKSNILVRRDLINKYIQINPPTKLSAAEDRRSIIIVHEDGASIFLSLLARNMPI